MIRSCLGASFLANGLATGRAAAVAGAFAVATMVGVLAGPPAQAAPVFTQGFEVDTDGWLDSSDLFGEIARVASGTNGIASFAGGFHAIASQSSGPGGFAGPFTRFDGYRSVFPGTYTASVAVYLSTGWASGEGFDYSVASNGSDGNHQRDFIFHVTNDTSTGSLLVGASNNTNFDPREDLDTLPNHAEIATSGWFVFEHVFRNDGGQLAVDLNLYDAVGLMIFSETRSDPQDTIPGEVGGNRYGWFTNIDIEDGIAIDQSQLEIVPLPPAVPLFATGLAALGLLHWRRRRKAA